MLMAAAGGGLEEWLARPVSDLHAWAEAALDAGLVKRL